MTYNFLFHSNEMACRKRGRLGLDRVIKEIKFSPKSGTGPDGKTLLIPKYKGKKIMISTFKLRGIGF